MSAISAARETIVARERHIRHGAAVGEVDKVVAGALAEMAQAGTLAVTPHRSGLDEAVQRAIRAAVD